jgi:hypothetical protein
MLPDGDFRYSAGRGGANCRTSGAAPSREEVNPVDDGARKLVQVALRSWALTLRFCVIVIVVVAAVTVLIPSRPVLDIAPRLFMT